MTINLLNKYLHINLLLNRCNLIQLNYQMIYNKSMNNMERQKQLLVKHGIVLLHFDLEIKKSQREFSVYNNSNKARYNIYFLCSDMKLINSFQNIINSFHLIHYYTAFLTKSSCLSHIKILSLCQSIQQLIQIQNKSKRKKQLIYKIALILEFSNQSQLQVIYNKDQNKKVVVQYAADLSSSIYGSGFPVYKMPNWLDSDFQYQTNYFNLNNISKSPSSLLSIFQKRKEKISGISYPWVYMGMMFSTFCWHVQDSFLNSLNYNHRGSTKTWYIIPKKYKERFDDYVKMKYQDKNHKKNVLQRITLMLDPLQLIKSGIKVYKVNQRPRQYICTFFKAYHCGFSHGFNVGQAVNFVSVKSLKYIQQAQRFYLKRQNEEQCKPKGLVLCKDWLLYENVNQKKLNNLSKKQCQQFKQYYLEMLQNQFDYLKKQLKLKNKLKYLNKHQIIVIDQQFKYDALKCQFCDNYIYLSAVSCKQCGVLCQNHIDHCQCIKQSKKPSFGLFIRYLNKDRFRIYTEFQLIKNAINAYNIQNKKKLIQNSLNKNEERLDQKPKSKRQSKQNRKIYKIKK